MPDGDAISVAFLKEPMARHSGRLGSISVVDGGAPKPLGAYMAVLAQAGFFVCALTSRTWLLAAGVTRTLSKVGA
jgi:hypothetical protein